MSPEIVKSEIYNESVDCWNFGIICYELLYGKPPFYSDTKE